MKRMACILDGYDVLEKCICSVCGKVHFITTDAWAYLDYMHNGPHPSVGRYDGWDDAMEIICDDCSNRAEHHFGYEFILSLLKHGELELVDFLANTARRIDTSNCKTFDKR